MLSQQPLLIGRDREQKQLVQLLVESFSGKGSVVLVRGEAGIGKTMLVRDFAQTARTSGAVVLNGACYDLATTPPYGPWTEAIRSFRPTGAQPSAPSWFSNPAEFETLGNQVKLFEETQRFFRNISEHQPLLIVLEDLHWSDQATPSALRYLARSLSGMRMLVVVTYRDDEPVVEHPFLSIIPSLIREADAQRIDLGRWGSASTRDLVESRYRLAEPDVDRLTSYCHALAEGNPFYSVELLQTLENSRALTFNDDAWGLGDLTGTRIPPLVRFTIERRLLSISGPTRELLQIAAAIGQRAPFSLWHTLSDATESQLVDAVREAMEIQIVDELPDRSGIQFRHALVRETLYADANVLWLRKVHTRIAELMELQPAPDPDAVVHHFVLADDDRAFDWLIRAGERAQRAYAWTTAQDRYEMALRVVGADGTRAHARAWLHYRIGVNQRASDPAGCLEHLAEARRLALHAGDELLDTYASIIEGLIQEFQGSLREGIRKIEAGVARLDALARSRTPHQPHALQTTLFADSVRLNHEALQGVLRAPNPGRGTLVQWYAAVGLCDKALSTGNHFLEHEVGESGARESAGHAVYDAYLGTGVAHVIRGEPDQALEALTWALDGYRRWDHRILASATCHTIVESVLLPYFTDRVRDRDDMVKLANRLIEGQAAAAGATNPMGYYDPSAAWPLIVSGDWDTAWEISSVMVRQASAAVWKWRATYVLGWLSWARGELDNARQYIDSVIPDPGPSTPGDHPYLETIAMQRLAARLALDSGEPATARAWLAAHDRWLAWADAVHGRAEGRLLWADCYLVTGDEDRARDAAGQALQQAMSPHQPLLLISIHRMLGRLGMSAHDLTAAGEHFSFALQLADRCKAVYEAALVKLDLAQLAIAARDRRTALDQLPAARETFEALGARPALDKALELEATLAGNVPAYPGGLSAREVEVLCLVASGMSNREVADRLYLSVRTVERHLTNIYRKIDVHSRVQASTFVDLHQLSVPPTA